LSEPNGRSLADMEEHHLAVAKTARYMILGDPASAREVWFVIHGYGQLASRFLRRFTTLNSGGRLIVAPEALNRYYFETSPGVHAQDAGIGATWMTREDRETEITDYVAYLETLYEHIIGTLPHPPLRIVALGFSQGAATAARWIARSSSRVTDVMLWGGFLPPEIEPGPNAFRGANLTLVHGSKDPYATPDRIARESQRLMAGGLHNSVVAFDGAHEVTDTALRTLLEAFPEV
jgi:predicted esterase